MENQFGHGLLLAFDTDEPQFSRGFELGRLWAILHERLDEEITQLSHATNAEMLLRLGEATGRHVRADPIDDLWVVATFAPEGVNSPP